jgi:hypothetical protein
MSREAIISALVMAVVVLTFAGDYSCTAALLICAVQHRPALDPSTKLAAVAARRQKQRVDLLDEDAAVLHNLEVVRHLDVDHAPA